MLALASTSFFAYDAAYITRTLNICTGFTAILFSLVKLGWRMELNAARCVAGRKWHISWKPHCTEHQLSQNAQISSEKYGVSRKSIVSLLAMVFLGSIAFTSSSYIPLLLAKQHRPPTTAVKCDEVEMQMCNLWVCRC